MRESTTALRSYLNEIGLNRVLTKEEEYALFERAHNGDEAAKAEIVACNLRLVVRIAQRFQGKGLALEDLIQEGNIGLIEVIDRFNHYLGFRFSTYAAFWIRQSIQVAIRKQGSIIRLPVRKMRMLGHLNDLVQEVFVAAGRPPTHEELALRLKISPAQVEELLQWSKTTLSLDMPLDDDGNTLSDHLMDHATPLPSQQTMQRELNQRIEEALGQLSEREHSILMLRFGLRGQKARSLRNISRRVGLSQEGVRRVEKRALAKLGRPFMRSRLVGLL